MRKLTLMKRSIYFLLPVSLLATRAGAQHLQLVAERGMRAGVRVMLKPATGKKILNVVPDSTGRLLLPTAGYPYEITVSGMNIETTRDTIASRHDKVIWLQSHTIGEVVITGQYGQMNQENAVQRIEVIDRKKIDAMAAQNLRDVLTNQLEIRMSYDPILGTALNMQGSRSYGADAKILIDGVPVIGKVDGAIDLSQINLANIERVEIIKGPMSVSYGTDAIAGTVNLITRKTVKKGGEVSAGTYYETPGTYNVNLSGGLRAGKHSVRFDGFRNFFGGWNPGSDISFFDFTARPADASRVLLWKPREQYQGGVQYVYTKNKTSLNYKGNYFYELITNRGTPLAPYGEMAIDNRFHTWRKDNAIFLNTDVANGRHINVFAAYNAYKRIKEEAAKDLTTLAESLPPDAQDTSRYSEINSRGVFTSGNTGRRLDYEIGYDVNIQYANSTQIEDRKQQMGNYALYASAEYRPVAQFTVRPGLRYAYNTRYGAPLVPSLNLMYKPADGLTLRTSYARGFRQPGLKDLYFDFVDINHNIHGNPDLKAEYSNNFLASATYLNRWRQLRYKFNVSAYYNQVNDLITLVPRINGTANEYWYQNISNFTTRGLQANADFTQRSLTLSVGGAVMGTYNQLSEQNQAPAYSYSPELRGSATWSFQKQGLSVSAFYKYTGRAVVYVTNTAGDVVQSRMGSYSIADITVSKKLWHKRVVLSAGCKNLFDVSNVSSTMGGGGAHSSQGASAAVSMGRYYFFKTEFNFHK